MSIKNIIRKCIKIFFGIEGIRLFVKKQKKIILKHFYTRKYSADDLVAEMCKMGMKKGCVVFIHSSMTEFYNYTGLAIELIDKILKVIGDDGTLMMPCYPHNKKLLYKIAIETNNVVFDVNNTPSGAGYLSEVFRTYPGVRRSVNLQHSVCAYGKFADYFLSEHHISEIAWDKFSPYYKLAQTDGLIFSLGLEPYLRNVTLIHCTESILRNKYTYFESFFGKDISYNYLDKNQNICKHNMIIPVKTGVRSVEIIKSFFDNSKFRRSRISNLLIEVVESQYMYKRCIELAEKGISIYSIPSKKKYIKNGQFIKINETKK